MRQIKSTSVRTDRRTPGSVQITLNLETIVSRKTGGRRVNEKKGSVRLLGERTSNTCVRHTTVTKKDRSI